MITANRGKVKINTVEASEMLSEFSLIARGIRELLIKEYGTADADFFVLEAIRVSKLSDNELMYESRVSASELNTNNLS
ncbi:hypothetical protein [Robinsoniella peoriensis]|uniref:hypothetical protein n=1 Tax=Robinsoniella peoriensis TaxID=180332 RepID=UPI00362E14FA